MKYRRPQDGRGNKGNVHKGTQLVLGSFGIKTLESKWIDGRQIEIARVAVNHYIQRKEQIWVRIFPDKPITRKSADVRMGKGKGDPMEWVVPVTPGHTFFEVEGVSFDITKEALRLVIQELPVKTKFVVRCDYGKSARVMKMTGLKRLAEKGLQEKLENVEAAHNQMKLNHVVSPLENPPQIKIARRDITCMRTELQRKEPNK